MDNDSDVWATDSPGDSSDIDVSMAVDELTPAATDLGPESGDTCRICRSEGTADEPLFFPCKCSGSIRYVHQECLMEWLSHSHKKHCELCKTPFRFTKLYDAEMPDTLPFVVFLRRAGMHTVDLCWYCCRIALVGFAWLIVLPYMVRWTWRGVFWFADAGWARKAFKTKLYLEILAGFNVHKLYEFATGNGTSAPALNAFITHLQSMIDDAFANATVPTLLQTLGTLRKLNEVVTSARDEAMDITPLNLTTAALESVAAAFNTTTGTDNVAQALLGDASNFTSSALAWPQADQSVLSSWKYLAELTPLPEVNRLILDVFEGQLITCVVIAGFILVFLIREWVVQQQPLVNLEIFQNEQRERERRERDRQRLQRQAELLEQARVRLQNLQNEIKDDMGALPRYMGWENTEQMIDLATEHLRGDGTDKSVHFRAAAAAVMVQVRAARSDPQSSVELRRQIVRKIATLSHEEQRQWDDVILAEVQDALKSHVSTRSISDRQVPGLQRSSSSQGRDHNEFPGMDDPVNDAGPVQQTFATAGNTSPYVTQIQHILEENDRTLAFLDAKNETTHTHGIEYRDAIFESIIAAAAAADTSVPVARVRRQSQVLTQDELPITNAGSEAKINIRYIGGPITITIPEPRDEETTGQEEQADETIVPVAASTNAAQVTNAGEGPAPSAEESTTTDAPETGTLTIEVVETEKFTPQAGSSTESSYDLVVDASSQGLADAPQSVPSPDAPSAAATTLPEIPAENEENDENDVEDANVPVPAREPPGILKQIIDWFWGDLEPAEPNLDAAAAIPADEQRIDLDLVDREAPFVPFRADEQFNDPVFDNDPEVLAAAQQAGIDAEAVEDAEDLEGIFELIGLQGPLLGLLQTSCFCVALVNATVFGAVLLPYMWGKLVLSFLGSPSSFLIKAPLQIASSIADVVVDLTLVVGGWLTMTLAWTADLLFSGVEVWIPSLSRYNFTQWVLSAATTTAATAGSRLQALFQVSEPAEPLAWKWAFLQASVHAHYSLKSLQGEMSSILNSVGCAITTIADIMSTGSFSSAWDQLVLALSKIRTTQPARSLAIAFYKRHLSPVFSILAGIKSGELVFEKSHEVGLDPELVYWTSSDRALAVLIGYVALAALAALYVTLDTPITRSRAGQQTEKIIRDTLRQAGGVLKVILIISIEMLGFPLYCGLLLDLAFLPLTHGASVATRWAYAVDSPYTFCFVHWFVGTCYMFHFALFVSMCRKILRKGVLWFIRDPDDPTFHPVRDVLERSITTQLRKIGFSALVYGALVILCLGGVIWSISHTFEGIFPINWISTEPVLEFPLDLLLYNFLTPLVIRLFRPSDAVHAMYAWWLRRCARMLRLSHFLFHDRHKDEERRHSHASWGIAKSAAPLNDATADDAGRTDANRNEASQRDGRFVLTPCNDQYRPPKPGEAFVHFDDQDVYIADKDGKKNEHFAKVYVPPHFKLRITLFMVCLWMFTAFAGLCVTLVPLVLGRYLLAMARSPRQQTNDIYAYSIGVYILGGATLVFLQSRKAVASLRSTLAQCDLHAQARKLMHFVDQTFRCVYVYGFFGFFLPMLFAVFLQFYVILPLHTYLGSRPATSSSSNSTQILSAFSGNNTSQTNASSSFLWPVNPKPSLSNSQFPEHTVHILTDYTLGLLYVRITARTIMSMPTSRAAEAFRRVTAHGYLNPDIRLATRFFVLPAVLIAVAVLLVPLALTRLLIAAVSLAGAVQWLRWPAAVNLTAKTQMILYRYSYPLTAAAVFSIISALQVAQAVAMWRARIRDEVYLVGERLHNFGERRPPVGSRTVTRRER